MASHCPTCGAALPGKAAPPRCPACGVEIKRAAGPGVPFDTPRERGLPHAWRQTWRASLFTPGELFSRVPASRALGWAFFYAIGWVAFLVGANAVERPLTDAFFALLPYRFRVWGEMLHLTGEAALTLVILTPLAAACAAGLFHALLRLVAGGASAYRTTLRAVCYTYGVCALGAVPVLGWGVLPLVWALLLVVALARAHRVEIWQAAFAVLLPVVAALGVTVALLLSVAARLLR